MTKFYLSLLVFQVLSLSSFANEASCYYGNLYKNGYMVSALNNNAYCAKSLGLINVIRSNYGFCYCNRNNEMYCGKNFVERFNIRATSNECNNVASAVNAFFQIK